MKKKVVLFIKTGIVILNYNDYKTTIKLINKIKNYKNIDEFVIVDNLSTDNSYEELKKIENKNIKILKSDKNGGYGYGNNIGCKYLIDKYSDCNIIISNPDINFNEEVINNLTNLLKEEHIGIVAPVIIQNEEKIIGRKKYSIYKEILLNIVGINRIYNKYLNKPHKLCYNSGGLVEVELFSGCFFATKGNVMQKIDFFDENIFLYYEENILTTKLKKLGYKIIVDTNSEVIHEHSVSISKTYNNIDKFKLLKDSQYYYFKNYEKCSKLSLFLLNLTKQFSICILNIIKKIEGE